MKKILATLLASAMAFTAIGGLAACGGSDDSGPVLKVWCPQEAISGYEKIVPQFKEKYPDYASTLLSSKQKARELFRLH